MSNTSTRAKRVTAQPARAAMGYDGDGMWCMPSVAKRGAQIKLQCCIELMSAKDKNNIAGNAGAQYFGMKEAAVTVEGSCNGMVALIEKATKATHGGKMWGHEGEALTW